MILAAAVLIAFAVAVRAESYEIKPDPAAKLALWVYKTGILNGKKHLFVFERYQGKLEFDAGAPERSKVDLAIETASAVLKDDWLKASDMKKVHEFALGREMLEVARFPRMRFQSNSIARQGDGAFRAQGRLEIKGVEKPVEVEVRWKEEGARLAFSGKAEVRMKDYGLKPPGALLGAIGTKNEMTVEFVVVAGTSGAR